MGTPDWNGWLASIWGPSTDPFDSSAIIALVSNVVVGSNPPYTIQDFFTMYPKFAGPALLSGSASPEGDLTIGSATVANVHNTAGMAVGQPIAGNGIPDNTFIASITPNTSITLTNPATITATQSPLVIWNATAVPVPVLLAFIALASASLVQPRWLDTWLVAMGWFVAHFATLYARSDGNPNSTPGQIASQGLAGGIQISKQAGDVSVSYATLQGIENWGAFNLTVYGQQLVTMARIIGMGPMMLY
jgi:hypothetical protein